MTTPDNIREAVERLEAQLAERMKYAPKPQPHRFSVPPNERTMTVKVEDLSALLSLIRGVMPRPIEEAIKDGREYFIYLREPWGKWEKARWYEPWGNWQVGVIPKDPAREEFHGIGAAVPIYCIPVDSLPLPQEESNG